MNGGYIVTLLMGFICTCITNGIWMAIGLTAILAFGGAIAMACHRPNDTPGQ